jgi:excisionase family DNA binding protein
MASAPKDGRAQRDLIPVRAVAKRLGLSEAHVYTMAAQGQIPCVKFSKAVRFDPKDIETFIRTHRRRRTD